MDAWFDNQFLAVATPLVCGEYLRVIDTLSPEHKPRIEMDWRMVLPELVLLIPDERRPKRISRDPNDDKFIYCAVNSKADFLVTGDDDLKSLPEYYPFKIISPRDFQNLI